MSQYISMFAQHRVKNTSRRGKVCDKGIVKVNDSGIFNLGNDNGHYNTQILFLTLFSLAWICEQRTISELMNR